MQDHNASSQHTLRSVLRPAPPLAPEDSLRRCLYLTRFQPLATLPVLQNGYLCGIVSQSCLLPILEKEPGPAREQLLDSAVSKVMQPPIAIASPDMSVEEVGRLCAQVGLSEIPVVDTDGYCYGIVSIGDLLIPEAPTPRPAHIGGMATPFGVYLSDGTIRAGASDKALMTTGMLMTLLHKISYLGIFGLGILLQRFVHLPKGFVLDPDYSPPDGHPGMGIFYLAVSLLVIGLFLLLLRSSRLAGYHAAEHQTVHAVERGERLNIDVVRRMPRPHPRCGTNFVAAVLVFAILSQAFGYIPAFDGGVATLLAIAATLLTWRSVGTFLQARFTTRPATDRELASGIAAGEELLARYQHSPPTRPSVFQRIWFTGMPQVATGIGLMFLVFYLAGLAWSHLR